MKLFLVISLIVACLIAIGTFTEANKDLFAIPRGCADWKPSLFSPFICVDEETRRNFGAAGKRYIESNPTMERNPILLVPGLAGSGLEMQLKNSKQPYWGCSSNSDWSRLWLSISSFLLPGYNDCFFHNLAIHYDPLTRTYYNNEGVTIRAMDYGGVGGIDYLDSVFGIPNFLTAYFAPLIADLRAVGYNVGKDLRGSPYDWRQPYNASDLFPRMKTLIETMYRENGNRKVNIVAHSFGNIQTALFLQKQVSQAWKDTYIDNFISVAAPWAGAPQAIRAVLSGEDFSFAIPWLIGFVDPLKVRKVAREAGGVIVLIPEPSAWSNHILVETPTVNYTAAQYQRLFTDMGSPITATINQHLHGTLESIVAPQVPLHCLYGINHKTEIAYRYNSNNFDVQPAEIIYSDFGDGIVPGVSLARCAQFASQQPHLVEIKEFDLLNHMNVLTDEEVLQYILKIATHQPTSNAIKSSTFNKH